MQNKSDPIARLRNSLPQELIVQYSTIETLRAKFMRTERENNLAEQMNLLINNTVQARDPSLPPSLENRSEGRGLALIGPTGVGKTTSLREFFMNHEVFAGYRDPSSSSGLSARARTAGPPAFRTRRTEAEPNGKSRPRYRGVPARCS
jgi:hypothetical protein